MKQLQNFTKGYGLTTHEIYPLAIHAILVNSLRISVERPAPYYSAVVKTSFGGLSKHLSILNPETSP